MLVVANMSGMTVVASSLIKWSELPFFFIVGSTIECKVSKQEKSSWFVLVDLDIRSAWEVVMKTILLFLKLKTTVNHKLCLVTTMAVTVFPSVTLLWVCCL